MTTEKINDLLFEDETAKENLLRNKSKEEKNGNRIEIPNGVNLVFARNLTEANLSNRSLSEISALTSFPINLSTLNLSGNCFEEVPESVIHLRNLEHLNLSSNKIKNFDEEPGFCHSLINLDIANNLLISPPCWIWTKSPKNLTTLNLNDNTKITTILLSNNVVQKNSVITLEFMNCKLNSKHSNIFAPFTKLRKLVLGSQDFNRVSQNDIECFPLEGTKEFCNLENLRLANTVLYEISIDIKQMKYLKELDLSQNYLSSLPDEFCDLINLESCNLSYNNIQYLPEEFKKMSKLEVLILNSNKLYAIPDQLCLLPLKHLDLYDNELYEVPDAIFTIKALDVALNYLIEPDNGDYNDGKNVIRLLNPWRTNGCKINKFLAEEHSPYTTDDESNKSYQLPPENHGNRESTSSDWDSDDYWDPNYNISNYPPISSLTRFSIYVKKKMEEGSFCPADMHPESISEIVKNKKMLDPNPFYESDGQFDDYSSDES